MRRIAIRQRGVAMMLVLVMVVVASILGMCYLSVTTVKLASTENLLGASRARYLAESGLQHGLFLLRTGSGALEGRTAVDSAGPFYADGTGDSYVLYTEPDPAPLTYVLAAKATANGMTRTSRARIQLSNDYRNRLMALGPLSYWRLGEVGGTAANDQTGRNPGQYECGVQLARPGAIAGDLDQAAGFDGTDDHVELGNVDSLGGAAATFLVWFKADDFAVNNARLISKSAGTVADEHYWMLSTIRYQDDIRLCFCLRANGSTATLIAGRGALSTGRWTMAAATYDGTKMSLYKNGESVGQRPKVGDVNVDSGVAAWIGGNPDSETSRPFHGTIDEVAVFQRALSGSELRDLCNARMASVRVLSWE